MVLGKKGVYDENLLLTNN